MKDNPYELSHKISLQDAHCGAKRNMSGHFRKTQVFDTQMLPDWTKSELSRVAQNKGTRN